MNAYTTPRSLKPRVNDSFISFLSQFEINDHDKGLLAQQISRLTHDHQVEKKESSQSLKKELKQVQNKLDKVNERFLLNDSVDENPYAKLKHKLEEELKSLKVN